MKHLTEVSYLTDKENLLEKVNQHILNLMNQITLKLSENDVLILRPKNQSNRKRKYNDTQPKKSKFRKLPIHAKPKHPYTGRYGVKAEVIRQWYKTKITLPDEPSAEYCDIETGEVLEGLFCVAFSKSFSLK